MTVDTHTPTATLVASSLVDNNTSAAVGTGSNSFITNNPSQTLSFTGTAGDTLVVTGGGTTATTVFDAMGNASVTLALNATSTTVPTLNTIVATASDSAGTTGSPTTYAVTVDTHLPTATLVASSLVDVNASAAVGTGSNSFITNNTSQTLSFTGTAGDTLVVTDGATTKSTTFDLNGNASVTLALDATSTTAPTLNTIVATASDLAGSSSTNTYAVTVDTHTPTATLVATSLVDINASAAVGTGNNSYITNNTAQTLSFTGTAGDHLVVTDGATSTSTTFDSNGHASVTLALNATSATAPTLNTILATASDLAGSSSTNTYAVTVDTHTPTATLVATSLVDVNASAAVSTGSNSFISPSPHPPRGWSQVFWIAKLLTEKPSASQARLAPSEPSKRIS